MDRWKRKEAIKTMAGYVQALSLFSLSHKKKICFMRNMQYFETQFFLDSKKKKVPVKGMQFNFKHLVLTSVGAL